MSEGLIQYLNEIRLEDQNLVADKANKLITLLNDLKNTLKLLKDSDVENIPSFVEIHLSDEKLDLIDKYELEIAHLPDCQIKKDVVVILGLLGINV
jgi:hypothetical protein